jgi:integrase
LNWSVDRKLIAVNPVAGYKKPRRDDEVIMPPTVAEVQAIIKNAAEHLKRAILISFYTGLRPGQSERYQLKWSDVNMDEGVILIRSAQKGGPPSRVVPIHPDFRAYLAMWKEIDKKAEHLIMYRKKPVKSVKKAFRRAKKRAGITRRLRLYDLRHAFATALLASGADLKGVSELIGHSRTDTTTRVYQHTNMDLYKKTIGILPKLNTD